MADKAPIFHVRLGADIQEALDRAADRFGVSSSELCRVILRRCLGVPNKMDAVLNRRIEDLGRAYLEQAAVGQGRAA